MYKIYINEKPLLLMSVGDIGAYSKDKEVNVISRYTGKSKFLLNHVDLMEKSTDPRTLIIYSDDLHKLWSDFKSLFLIIKAAGGLVYNPDGEVLAIQRLGYWDLPKGKIEKGEKKKAAAIREVMEETGLKSVKLEHKLINTWHTYRHPRKKVRVLKKTFWYRMSAPDQELTPQAEEAIESALWINPSSMKQQEPIYENILDVLNS
ncbi:MAG: NUDIX hydrolase [Saprospiraceae bacterium]